MSVSSGARSSGRTSSAARSSAKPSSGSRSRNSSAQKSTAQMSTARKSTNRRSSAQKSSTQAARQTSPKRPTRGPTAAAASRANKAKQGAASSAHDAKQNVTERGDNRAASRNGQAHPARSAIARVGVPAVTGVVGIAGGVLLGRTALQYKVRKALGNPLLGKIDFGGVTEQIGEAEQQFGKLADEIRAARDKAEKLGRSLG